MEKRRLDRLMLERGLAESAGEARALIMRGVVYVEGRRLDKAGTSVYSDAEVEVRLPRSSFVSRGGLKLEAALDHFRIDPDRWVCVDLGASTGGFSDCLLQRGARRVYAFDVGRGQLDWNLRQDPRITLQEGFNVRHLSPAEVPEGVDLIVGDLSFISLRSVLPALRSFRNCRFLVLVKPQFEATREEVEPGGVIRNDTRRQEIVARVTDCAVQLGFRLLGEMDSPVAGQKGNREVFILLE